MTQIPNRHYSISGLLLYTYVIYKPPSSKTNDSFDKPYYPCRVNKCVVIKYIQVIIVIILHTNVFDS